MNIFLVCHVHLLFTYYFYCVGLFKFLFQLYKYSACTQSLTRIYGLSVVV